MEDNTLPPPAKKVPWSQRLKNAEQPRSEQPKIFEGDANEPVQVNGAATVSADAGIGIKAEEGTASYEDEVARIRALRKKQRRPFGSFTQKLAFDVRRGYHAHWFNDVPGRIEEAKKSGWTHSLDAEGKIRKRIVGRSQGGPDGGALYAYAMEIPEEFWLEEKQAEIEAAEAPIKAIKRSPGMARPGEAKAQDNEKFYSPRETFLDIQRK